MCIYQALSPARNADCVVRESDESLQTRARMGEVCPYCHSDEIPLVSAKTSLKAAKGGNKGAPLPHEDVEGSVKREKEGASRWGEQVVHCDGCDRPCHLRCIFRTQEFDKKQLLQPEAQEQGKEQLQQQQEQGPLGEQQHQRQPDQQQLTHTFDEKAVTENGACAESLAAKDSEVNVVAEGEESIEKVYRWFVEGDCKWYCCVCRLQWERMAAAMNFSVDWEARRVLREGNPLLLPEPEASASKCASCFWARRAPQEGDAKDNDTLLSAQQPAAGGGKRRSGQEKKSTFPGALAKRQRKANDASPRLTRSFKAQESSPAEGSCDGVEGAQRNGGLEPEGSVSQGSKSDRSGYGAATEDGITTTAATSTADVAAPVSGAGEMKPGASAETQENGGPGATSFAVADSPVAAPGVREPQLSGADRGTLAKMCKEDIPGVLAEAAVGDCGAGGEEAPTCSFQRAVMRTSQGVLADEPLRVYRNSREKVMTSKMQPSPVAITPQDLSEEEQLGCRTEMLVEPRALLGSLQPCVRCYKLYGAKASVEVCRLTKRHLGPNWDHPHFSSPAQIQDALLTCFQDALLTLQRDHRMTMEKLFDSMSPLQREMNRNDMLCNNRYSRIHESAARRNADNMQKQEIHSTEVVTKGVIPLLAVTIGKTKVDCKYKDPQTQKAKWYYGCVTAYQAVATEVHKVKARGGRKKTKAADPGKEDAGAGGSGEEQITFFTNQFRIEYDDGDIQHATPYQLLDMLIQTGPRSKLDGRKVITTTPLSKMLSPELKRANRQVNLLVRKTNRKVHAPDVVSDSDEE